LVAPPPAACAGLDDGGGGAFTAGADETGADCRIIGGPGGRGTVAVAVAAADGIFGDLGDSVVA
jgi:hypothetical protein